VHADRTASSDSNGLTSCVVTEAEHSLNYDARIISSRIIAQEGVYPALDVRLTSPSKNAAQAMTANQRQVCHTLIDSLKRLLEDLSPGALRDPNWKFNSDPSLRPTVQALRFLSQPYFTAEIYTGLKSAFVPTKQTTQSFKWILDGKFREASPSLFVFKNELPDI
jgi:F-type H+-transporting ATPase subunit beta